MDERYKEECNFVWAVPPYEWRLAGDRSAFNIPLRLLPGYSLPNEIEQNEGTDPKVSTDPVDLAIRVNRLVFWHQEDRRAVD